MRLKWLTIFFGFGRSRSCQSLRSKLTALCCLRLKPPELGDHHVLQDLIRFFAIERPHRPQLPPSWDLDVVLRHIMSAAYEPLESLSLRSLTKKTLFLVALTTAKRVGNLVLFLGLFLRSG